MNLDFHAIIKAYPNARVVDEDKGVFDSNNKEIILNQTLIDSARTTLDAEYAAVKYKDDRKAEYPDWNVQLDYIYHNGIEKWKTDIVDPVKNKYPKPS